MTEENEIEDEREMTIEEKKRLREILGYGLSAALPLAYHPEDDAATIARLTAELDAAQKTIVHWESHDFEDDIDDATAEMSGQLAEARADNRRLTAQLAAMTERKDGWRRAALAWREEALKWIEARSTHSDSTTEYIGEWSRERREARNGHTD